MMYLLQESRMPGFHGMPLWNDFPLRGYKIERPLRSAVPLPASPSPSLGQFSPI